MLRNEYKGALHSELSNIVAQKMPYFNDIGIKEFGYRQFRMDGTTIGYCSQNSWNKLLEDQNLYNNMISHYNEELAGLTHEKVNFRLRSGKRELTSPFLEALYHHGLWNILVVYRRYNDRIEGFYFVASREDEEMINSYVEKRDTFEKIVTSMELPLNAVISEQRWDNQRVQFQVPKLIKPRSIAEEVDQRFDKNNRFQKNLCFQYLGQKLWLSQNIIEYLLYSANGFKHKEVSQKIYVSKSTVDSYAHYLKNECGLSNEKERIKFIYTLRLDKYLKGYSECKTQ